jgi:hypothetical protein
VRSARFFFTDSPHQPLRFDRQTAQRFAGLSLIAQCSGSLVLLLVLTTSALAIVATISILVSVKDLISNANSDWMRSVEIQNSRDEKPRHPQP